MRIEAGLTDPTLLERLGRRIERHRLEANLTQAELAERAGIGKRTLERLEAGNGAALVTLVRVLRALQLLDGLDQLVPELPPSPIQQLKLRGKQRQRVSHRRRRAVAAPEGPIDESASASSGKRPAKRANRPWKWGTPPVNRSS